MYNEIEKREFQSMHTGECDVLLTIFISYFIVFSAHILKLNWPIVFEGEIL